MLTVGVVALALSIGSRSVGAETIDRVLAVAGGQIITLSDVIAMRELGLMTDDGAPDPVETVLHKLIDRDLVLVEVERYAPAEPDLSAIDRELGAIRARFGSAQAFAGALARFGMNEARLREIVREDLRIRAYLAERFTGAEDESRRLALVNDWIAGLRRRASIVDLYSTLNRP